MQIKLNSKVLNFVNFVIFFIFVIPYEGIFNYLYPRLSSLFKSVPSTNVNNEPLFLKSFADLQYELFIKQLNISFLLILFVFFIFQLANATKKNSYDTFTIRHFLVTNFFYFVFLESLIYTSRFYCLFSADEIVSTNCEQIDTLLYFGTLLPLYQVIKRTKYYFLYKNNLINRVIYAIYFSFFLINIGIVEFYRFYPGVEVQYQNLLKPNVILFTTLLVFGLKYKINPESNLIILISLSLVLLNSSFNLSLKFFLIFLLLIISFTKIKLKKIILKITEVLLVLIFLISISFKHILLPLTINQKTILNEFSSTLNGGIFFEDYFNNYNNLFPYFFKLFKSEELSLFLNFKIFMATMSFLILLIISYLLYKLFPNYFLISIFSFIGFSIITESENFTFFNNGTFQYYQTFPLRYFTIITAIFLYYLYKKNKISHYVITLFNIVIIVDNLYIGISLSIAFILVELIQNLDIYQSKFKNLIKTNKLILLSMFSIFIYIYTFKDSLFLYFSEEYLSLLDLPIAPLGTHKFTIYSTMIIIFIFSQLIQTSKSKNLIAESLILLSAFSVLILYFYFTGRSHPQTFYSVLPIFTLLIILVLNYFLEYSEKNLILYVFPLIILVNGFLNSSDHNNFSFYRDNLNNYDSEILHNQFLMYESYDNIILSKNNISTLNNSNVAFLLNYGSIIAIENNLSGHSPFMKYNLTKEQCNVLEEYLTEKEFEYLVIPSFQEKFYHDDWYYSDCFKNLITYIEQNLYKNKIKVNDDISILKSN